MLWSYGQKKDITFDHLTPEQGFFQTTVFSIIQDRQGFIWFGGTDGLTKYDGYSFTVYKRNPFDSNSIAGNSISALLEDCHGFIWIALWGNGLNRYDPVTDTFTHFLHRPSDPETLNDNRVQILFEDRFNTLWIGTFSGGLSRFYRQSSTFIHYRHDPEDPSSLASNRIWSMCEDKDGNLWIGTNSGLDRFHRESEDFIHYTHDPEKSGIPSQYRARVVYADHLGDLWIGTQEGLDRRDSETGKLVHFVHNPSNPNSISNNIITVVCEDSSDTLWVGTNNGGLNRYNRADNNFSRFFRDPTNPGSINHNDIRCIMEDRSEILWIGTRGGAVNKLDLKPRKFQVFRHSPFNANSLSVSRVHCIYEDHAGVLWIGTDHGGLNRFDMKSGKDVHYLHQPTNPESISSNLVWTILEDQNGEIWVGTDRGINRFNEKRETFVHYRHEPNNPGSLSNDLVFEIYEDKSGILWVGTDFGLNKFNREKEQFIRYTLNTPDDNQLVRIRVRHIHEDDAGVFWIASNRGLIRFDKNNTQVLAYRYDPAKPSCISDDNVFSICEDGSGMLWIGTIMGLNRFDSVQNNFVSYFEEDGLPNDLIFGILMDDDGNLWLSTNNGLSRLDPKTRVFRNYDVNDGLQSNTFSIGAFHHAKSGEMFFGGFNGFNAFFPSRITNNTHVPPIVLTDFQIFNKSVDLGENSPLQKSLTFTEEIALSYTDDVFSFEFSSLDFTIPGKNHYAYIMEGFNDRWTFTRTRREATYTNLDPGNYIFRVIGSNNDEVWNNEGVAMKIVIAPPFWQTVWFRLLALAAIILATYTIYRIRVRTIHNQKKQLEILVAERTRDLAKLIEIKNEFLGMAAHDLRSPLGGVIGYTELMILDMKENRFKTSEIISDLELVHASASRMADLITQLLDISAIESGKINLNLYRENLNSVFEECERIYRKAALQKKISLIIERNESLPEVMIDKSRIVEVVDNLLSNAIKYTFKGGVVCLFAESKESEVIVNVQDSGQGLSEEDQKEMFKSFKKLSSKPTGGESSTGLGLAIVKKLVERHGGRVWVKSKKGKGSTFCFSLPVK